MSAPLVPDLSFRACPVSRLSARPVAWLWPGRLPLGKLSILDGDPGLGKSLVTLDLCARLSTGRPWPDGSPGAGPAAAVVLNAEDGAEDTIRPRLEACGADLDRVFVLPRDESDMGTPLRLPGQAAVLEAIVAGTGARLVVIDPVLTFLGPGVNTSSDQGVRWALAPLARLAERRGCAVLLVRHLNKSGGSRSLYRGLGSIGLVGACRTAWLIADDPRAPGRRVLAPMKNNLAAPQPALAFEVVPRDGGPLSVSWQGPTDWKADALLAEAQLRPRRPTPREAAREFLADLLRDGPRTTREIWEKAEERGLSARTLQRAARQLKVTAVRVFLDGRVTHYWLLPGQDLPPEVPPEARPPELDPAVKALLDLCPPPTPLDNL
jgi:hypothetical protein